MIKVAFSRLFRNRSLVVHLPFVKWIKWHRSYEWKMANYQAISFMSSVNMSENKNWTCTQRNPHVNMLLIITCCSIASIFCVFQYTYILTNNQLFSDRLMTRKSFSAQFSCRLLYNKMTRIQWTIGFLEHKHFTPNEN